MAERLTSVAHEFIAPVLRDACIALDATVGTGADTAFLAAGVGPAGRVHAFDIQNEALCRARPRLAAAGLADRVHWHLADHAHLSDHVGPDRFAAAMFNLGWLPGGDATIVTRVPTTVAALAAAAARLETGGRLSVVAYRGHAGGPAEQRAVEDWIADAAHGLELIAAVDATGGHGRGPVFRGLARS